jgi:hypothetical protein
MAANSPQIVHGLRLRGAVSVPGAPPAEEGAVDFEVRVQDRATQPAETPPGEVVAALEWSGGGYTATARGNLLTVRFIGSADFEVDLAAGTIAARPTSDRGAAMLPILLAGNVLALVLGLRGAPVLHASTVEMNGEAVAFAGTSGAGKSTLAALLCSTGARLVADDSARVEANDGAVLVHRGPAEIRLRPQAAALAGTGTTRTTTDERIALSVEPVTEATVHLGAVVLPRWRRDDANVPELAALGAREALEELLRCPRVTGWRISEPISTHFDACATIAQRTPAFRLEIPRGRLDDPDLPVALREVLVAAR